jgi:hypothetical protein
LGKSNYLLLFLKILQNIDQLWIYSLSQNEIKLDEGFLKEATAFGLSA